MTDEYDPDNILAADLSTSRLSIDPDTDHDIRGAVPNGELRDLVDKWNEEIDEYPETNVGDAAYVGVDGCIAELNDLIDEHTHE